ncbi:cell division protein FtsZ [Paeniroseomonas aquatica]|uniref:Cell division protein FtsZ n=1 Tax=Paeniroseomonas aquatica TaxID=373043 RepID=A0ABT8A8M9_9PROT|nr:cell division protein FtsZ [Paeniroseomonas aquatica]MDN3566167.1 cell division protein FtsZ [Paeniroseomonas aquatica]
MTLNLTLPVAQHTDFSPRITVIGVGGGGTNAVNNMIAMGLQGVEFVVANTDAQSLVHSKAEKRVQLGPHLTQGLGAGAKPEIGRAAAEEATEELSRHLDGCHMVFITAGMGGGTGTGAAPVIARMARERGVLTVGVVTKPFDFEGPKRRRASDAGIEELQSFVDTLIIIPNQNLFRMATERTTFAEAFKLADEVLYDGVRGVTDLMIKPGLVNLDFADIRTVMAEMGKAVMGTGEADGDDRAVKAAERAISNPLLDDASLRGARGVLINITGGYDMTLFEVDEAANRIRKEVDEDAQIIFGTSVEEDLNGRLRVSVVATGIDAVQPQAVAPATGQSGVAAVATQSGLTMLPGGRQGRPAMTGQGMGGPAMGAAAVNAGPIGAPRVAAPVRGGALRHAAAPATGMAATGMPQASAPAVAQAEEMPAMQPVAMPAATVHPAPLVDAQRRPAVVAGQPMPQVAVPAAPVGAFGGLFRRVTGAATSGTMLRRTLVEPQPVAPQIEQAGPARQADPQVPGRVDFEIPTFLRRQTN